METAPCRVAPHCSLASRFAVWGAHRGDFGECAVPVRPGRSWHRVDYGLFPRESLLRECPWCLYNVLFWLFSFVVFSYCCDREETATSARRRLGMCPCCGACRPRKHRRRGASWQQFSLVRNVINGLIKTAVNSIKFGANDISNFLQHAPGPRIDQSG